MKAKQLYKIVCSDGTEEEFDSPSDNAALSKCLNRALSNNHEGVWTLYYKGPIQDETLGRVTRAADRSVQVDV